MNDAHGFPTFELVQLHGGPWAGLTLSPPGPHERFALGLKIRAEGGYYLLEGPAGGSLGPEYGRAVFKKDPKP